MLVPLIGKTKLRDPFNYRLFNLKPVQIMQNCAISFFEVLFFKVFKKIVKKSCCNRIILEKKADG